MSNISQENSEFDIFFNESRHKSMFGTQYSYKAMNYCQQPIQHFLNFDLPNEQQEPDLTGRMPEETTKEMLKVKNRIKAKHFRDKKKHLAEMAQHKLKELESENASLKQTKVYCGRCKTKIQKSKSATQIQEQKPPLHLQFEPPQFAPEKTPKGKIWIALGLIMLIIGVNIHGFNKQPIEINLHNSLVSKLQRQLGNDQPIVKIPFSMRQKQDMFRQKPPDRKVQPSRQGVLMIEGGDQQQVVAVNKDFIMQLHAQINELGNYL